MTLIDALWWLFVKPKKLPWQKRVSATEKARLLAAQRQREYEGGAWRD